MEKQIAASNADSYLQEIPEPSRSTLLTIRVMIKEAAPEAEEVISYQIPTFKYKGGLVAYAAFKKHCSFFIMSIAVAKSFEEQLKDYDTSKGTIRFSPNKPLPAELVHAIVKARMAENDLLFSMKKSKKV
jgi:uncharacterized protein YdhG (YjbR/CyaY superfamily)